MKRKKVYRKICKRLIKLRNMIKTETMFKGTDSEDKYILERIGRLSIEVKQNMLPKSREKYMIVKYSRPIFEICANIINLIEKEGYANYLDKDSERRALENSRDYLRGSIGSQEKKERLKFLERSDGNRRINKFAQMPISCIELYLDSSAIIHDNQVSYKQYPKKEDIRHLDNMLLYLITYIYRRLCSKYEFTKNKYIDKIHGKMYINLKVDYKAIIKIGKKENQKKLKRIGG
ncbi:MULTISPECIES: hypothetical protein [Bacillus]|nr:MULTISPECIES: hypothetical protein [Bacillus]